MEFQKGQSESNERAVQVLQDLLARKALCTQVDAWIDRLRQGDTWYTRARDKFGAEVAEADLAEYRNRCATRFEFAAGIESVVRGMLALAQSDPKGEITHVIDVDAYNRDMLGHPLPLKMPLPTPLVLIMNRSIGFALPEGAREFSSGGLLGIEAFSIVESVSGETQLGIVLSQKNKQSLNSDQFAVGYAVVTINLNGSERYHYYSAGFDQRQYFRYRLGLSDLKLEESCGSGGRLDEQLGFPGASDYLAKALPRLGKYLIELAERRS